ncbi:type II toxin-antitoxin system RelE family toxin [Pedobacter xixiisoli]|uniref:mRNA-degrading endonuclease RelE, toxin component of the RelBE toxin-antitoxin system n=1 Tax=Pedobacter xixiisoli TaxID=1476464 RepID=A0A286AA65_9SPHI|nr:type II toxin-antitoxin system RelE/ParE family toxin [Pedobacter xixiisoli]SOD18800.1 mRNA-degrading endonuclease RelE, toxin component of the RelBE toxin-antitoxin system [Pedobacter xixiisoli]
MVVQYNKKFLKDLSSLPKKDRDKIENFVFDEINQYNSSSEINKLEKLSGYQHYYKIRFGNFRIGIKLENESLTFERVLHRKEIYKLFP